MKKIFLSFTFLLLNTFPAANANNVSILAAAIIHQSHGEYLVNVKLQHQDIGWEHYADEWRLIDAKGNILGSPREDSMDFNESMQFNGLS